MSIVLCEERTLASHHVHLPKYESGQQSCSIAEALGRVPVAQQHHWTPYFQAFLCSASTNLHMIRKWHSILHSTVLLIGPLTNRKELLCKCLFLWTLPKPHVLSQMEIYTCCHGCECWMHVYTISSLLPFSTTGRIYLKSPPQSTTIPPKGLWLSRIPQSAIYCSHAIPMLHGDPIPNNYNNLLEKVCLRAILKYIAIGSIIHI